MVELARSARRAISSVTRLGAAALLCLAAVLFPATAGGAAAGDIERQVKAAYLYKFASFVEWPQSSFAGSSAPLTIGVAGSERLAVDLERMVAGRTAGGRAVKVRRTGAASALGGVHILFVDASVGPRDAAAMLAAAAGQSVLTVSDAEQATANGYMIGFVTADERLRFDVALAQVTSGGLRIGARMLAVAHRVRGAS